MLTLQYHVGFCPTSSESAVGIHMSLPLEPPSTTHPSHSPRLSQNTAFGEPPSLMDYHWLVCTQEIGSISNYLVLFSITVQCVNDLVTVPCFLLY